MFIDFTFGAWCECGCMMFPVNRFRFNWMKIIRIIGKCLFLPSAYLCFGSVCCGNIVGFPSRLNRTLSMKYTSMIRLLVHKHCTGVEMTIKYATSNKQQIIFLVAGQMKQKCMKIMNSLIQLGTLNRQCTLSFYAHWLMKWEKVIFSIKSVNLIRFSTQVYADAF